jgi:hypothetical protein
MIGVVTPNHGTAPSPDLPFGGSIITASGDSEAALVRARAASFLLPYLGSMIQTKDGLRHHVFCIV